MITSAGTKLLRRAQRTRDARRDIAIADLLALVNAISLATEREPEPAQHAERLLALVVNGVRYRE
jgi:hypothetical protein